MLDLILMLLGSLIAGLPGQAALQAENIALRHQLNERKLPLREASG